MKNNYAENETSENNEKDEESSGTSSSDTTSSSSTVRTYYHCPTLSPEDEEEIRVQIQRSLQPKSPPTCLMSAPGSSVILIIISVVPRLIGGSAGIIYVKRKKIPLTHSQTHLLLLL
ncbi:hypothetical protein SRHO_G00178200 [Serrasalmus rhombeus]